MKKLLSILLVIGFLFSGCSKKISETMASWVGPMVPWSINHGTKTYNIGGAPDRVN